MATRSMWDGLDAEDRLAYEEQAHACLRVLPQLMGRIASRCRAYAQVLDAWEQAERRALRRMKEQ